MKTNIILIICILLLPSILQAQKKSKPSLDKVFGVAPQRINKHGQKINRWGIIIEDQTATEEKKYLTLKELNALTASDSTRDIFESKNNDTLLLKGKKYIITRTPITALFDKSTYILYEEDEIGFDVPLQKKYILHWEVKKDSLYIVNYDIAPDYQGDKTKEDVGKEIERLWGKKFKHGELNIDWMVMKGTPKTTVQLLVRDCKFHVYCLTFENNKFIKMEENKEGHCSY